MEFGLDHIHFRCEDVDTAIDFYTRMFGGYISERSGSKQMPVVFVNVAGIRLAFSPKSQEGVPAAFSNRPDKGIYQLGLCVNDVDKAVEELRSKGAQIEREPSELRPGLKAALVKAPDGVQIELVEHTIPPRKS